MISVILINYHSATLLLGAVSSVLMQRDVDTLEIIVIDNSVCANEKIFLKERLPASVIYVQNTANIGFAKACNQAFARSRGDFILLLNPDVRLLSSALSRLVHTFEEYPRAGAVGPQIYWDEACQFLLPPNTIPTFASMYGRATACLHPLLAHYRTLIFRKKALRVWTSLAPVQVEALSGGHVLLRRDALSKCNGLFDRRFATYWEDTDLMRRLQIAGYRCYVNPSASCVHHYIHTPDKDRLIGQGWEIYQMKYFQGKLRFQFINWLTQHLPPVCSPHFEPLSRCDDTLVFPVPASLETSWLLELSASPHFIPSIGYFGSGSVAKVGALYASRLHKNTYFARLSAPVLTPNQFVHWHWQQG